MSAVPKKDYIYVDIYKGGELEGGINLDLVDEVDTPLAYSDGWRLRCQVRTSFGGSLAFTLADSGADGTIAVDEWGHVFVLLPSTFTQNMTATTDSSGANNRHLVGDIDVWNTATPTAIKKPSAELRVIVYPEVTTS